MLYFAGILCIIAFSFNPSWTEGQAVRPYMGWSSWSIQATTMPGRGSAWLKEDNIISQIDAMAANLKQYGYTYINLDSGWAANWDWHARFDNNGRSVPDPERFPRGIKWLADYAHEKGLKLGIYGIVGLPKGVFGDDESNKVNFPVANTTNCTGFDLVYPDWRTTNGWDASYKMDFDNPCSQAYIDSIAQLFADWGVDFFKLDGVGPGSWKNGTNYDNRPDVAAWRSALDKTGRRILFEISWELDITFVDHWKTYADGWRIDTDVECYCDTLVRWDASVVQRFRDLPPWVEHAGPGRWNDLDTINVGNGTMDGLTEDERQTYATLWAISCAPLYIGDDLTMLDDYGISLLTNREVIDINQNGVPARPVFPGGGEQVWWSKSLDDNSYVVGMFNLMTSTYPVVANWEDFGFNGTASVKNVWTGEVLGNFTNSYEVELRGHASQLLRVTPL